MVSTMKPDTPWSITSGTDTGRLLFGLNAADEHAIVQGSEMHVQNLRCIVI